MHRILGWFGQHRPHPHTNHREALAALERGTAALEDAETRAARADVVVARLHRRVFTENHISEGIAALWRGNT